MGAVAKRVLQESVRAVVGSPEAQPRPGQSLMLGDLVDTLGSTWAGGQGFAQAEGPTGVGKSMVVLSLAAAAAAARGQRSVVSTETLALQSQIIDKDAPVVADACHRVTGCRPQVAVMKGWSNYVCTTSSVEAGRSLLERLRRKPPSTPGPAAMLERVSRALETKKGLLSAQEREQADLTVWALEQTAAIPEGSVAGPKTDPNRRPSTYQGPSGDRGTFTGPMSNPGAWEAVSVASGDCLGADHCSFADRCLPRAARAQAAEADIVVVNHTLLGVQAANNIPVVVGSKSLGVFDNIFVDEAHGLPQAVRNQGAQEVSDRAVLRMVATLRRTLDDSDARVADLLSTGEAVAAAVGRELRSRTPVSGPKRDQATRLGDGEDPLAESGPDLRLWLEDVSALLAGALKATKAPVARIKLLRAKGRVASMQQAHRLCTEHRSGTARWMETVTPHQRAHDTQPYPVVRYTPVDVAGNLRASLWVRPLTADEESGDRPVRGLVPGPASPDGVHGDEPGQDESAKPDALRVPLSVVLLSATMPTGFGVQTGVRAPLRRYPSPFDAAYGRSVLYVPRAVADEDVQALAGPYTDARGRSRFDTSRHREWALPQIVELVEANRGSALVLAATAAAGREYARALSAASAGRWKVLSQWEGAATRLQVAAWKKDQNAVLVGTRSLMTGVDAPGKTCTLVVVDRAPRAASNPVDDARIEALMESANLDKWTADRMVYVADAALLLEQAAGRLVRSVTDAGMCAILDPRLLRTGPYSQPAPTRALYLDSLHRFTHAISGRAEATAWLHASAGRRGMKVA